MNARGVAIVIAALGAACGGADGSPLLETQDGATPLDATAPLDATPGDAAPPKPDGGPVDAGPPLDAAPPVDAGPPPYQDPGIACGKSECDAGTQLCCATITTYYPQYQYSYACAPASQLAVCAAGISITCDDDHDCEGGQVCCGDLGYQQYAKVSCKPTCTGTVYNYQQIHFCDPKAPDCDGNQTCVASTVMPGYFVCQ